MKFVVVARNTSAAEQTQPGPLSFVVGRVEATGEGTMATTGTLDLAASNVDVSVLLDVDVVISWGARSDAATLARHDPRVLGLHWRCASDQWPWFSVTKCSLQELSLALNIAEDSPAEADSAAAILLRALNRRTGKTSRSKTHLQSILQKGEVLVFRNADPNPIPRCTGETFSAVYSDVFLKCQMATTFQLWSRPDYDEIIGYPRGTPDRLPSAFHISKAQNAELARRVDSGESLCMAISRLEDDAFWLEIRKSDYVPIPAPGDA